MEPGERFSCGAITKAELEQVRDFEQEFSRNGDCNGEFSLAPMSYPESLISQRLTCFYAQTTYKVYSVMFLVSQPRYINY
ncbi:hypothetical protein M8C21_032605 [Ambrosia artemisiifolia]|uniref:Uncharacterized protein n=1 Tax=Ambrosia artemisiifolia TaxID=4212 RepID=A0AAD5GLN7_AMBAR|nr:hypothetical protein M8C21_032605 [Ambrosia artemisiifolia]